MGTEDEMLKRRIQKIAQDHIPDNGALHAVFTERDDIKRLSPEEQQKRWADTKTMIASFVESKMLAEPSVEPKGNAR